jgi:Bacterial RNA polymerase, alpha chain C terminal domain
MFEVPAREFLAFHEAGHAVMATILGRPIRRASIRERYGLSGHVEFERAMSAHIEIAEEHRPLIEADVLVLLAGRAAECEHTLGSPRSHAGLDRENARALLGNLEDCDEVVSSWIRYLLVRAQSMLQAEWPLVYSVARALMRDEELNGEGVACAIAEARRRRATQEPSNCRFVISERALDGLSQLPRPECHVERSERVEGLLRFPDDRSTASCDSVSREDADLFRRTITEAMQLSARARNCLARAGITTVGDLHGWAIRDLQSIRALSPKTLEEIVAEVRRLGVTLPADRQRGLLTWPRR